MWKVLYYLGTVAYLGRDCAIVPLGDWLTTTLDSNFSAVVPLGDLLSRKSARKQRQISCVDPFFVFPDVTRLQRRYSGLIQTEDLFCLLPLQ